MTGEASQMGELFDRLERAANAALQEDWDGFLEVYADDVEAWSPGYDVRGRDAWLQAIKAQNGPFEVRQELWLIAETENTVVIEWTWSIPHPDGSGRWV